MFGVNYAKQQFLVEIKIDIKIDFVHMFIFYVHFRTIELHWKKGRERPHLGRVDQNPKSYEQNTLNTPPSQSTLQISSDYVHSTLNKSFVQFPSENPGCKQ